jgi:hypothetical protein
MILPNEAVTFTILVGLQIIETFIPTIRRGIPNKSKSFQPLSPFLRHDGSLCALKVNPLPKRKNHFPYGF